MKKIPLTLFIGALLFGCSKTTKNLAEAPENQVATYPHYNAFEISTKYSTESNGEDENINYTVRMLVINNY